MAKGEKRAKLKKAFGPPSSSPAPISSTATDDSDLLDDLLSELDSRSPVVQQEAANVIGEMQANGNPAMSPPPPPSSSEERSKKGSRQKFKEREQRKAQAVLAAAPASDPEADARLEREAKDEEKSINATCHSLGLQIYEINPDGHCLFSAIADQLSLLGLLPPSASPSPSPISPASHSQPYTTTRHAAATYMLTHSSSFLPFVPSLDGEDGLNSTDTGLMTPAGFERYCANVRNTGMWGGEPEIMALSRAYDVPIHVVQGGPGPTVVKHSPREGVDPPAGSPIVYISYHRRMYGLGEHYNSLRPKGSKTSQLMNKIEKNFGHLSS